MEKELFADDRPIARVSEDALGFSKPAESIATSIIDFASPEGFVMGLEGDWGTGKSSFLNLIAGHLKESSTAPEIIQFSPWLISSRNGLLAQFFSEIGRAAQVIAEEAEGTKKDDLQNLSNKGVKSVKSLIDNYSGGLIVLGNIGRLAGLAGIPWASDIGQKVLDFGETAQSLSTDKPLEEQKEEIKEALRSLHRQIVVFIDDLDRLEPKEVGEVVRLVRAVGDFPNIIYVLSYSRPILTRNLAKAFNLKASDPYIDKIVQVTFQVPKPEGFTLRNLFRKRLQSIFPDAFKQDDVSRNNPGLSRLNEAIDKQGGKTLKTPRDVARVLNAMRLYGSSAAEKTDLGDMVWLQMIRVRNPELYDWIESYMGTVGAIINAKGQVKSEIVSIVKRAA
ncbi:MAG: P-loop NTPase fold protein [Pseudomonadota bacterium]